MADNISISVVIRTLNEEQWIGHTIQSVLDHIPNPEIIIIDNNSTDDTLKVVKLFQKDPNLNDKDNLQFTKINIIKIEDYTPGKAINIGVKESSNNYVLIVSSHCIITKIDIKKHKMDLDKHICIFGNQIPVFQGKRIRKRYIWSHFQEKEIINMYSKVEERYFMHNALAFYKKSSLIDYPFDEYLIGKEDRYWANKIISNGFSTLYDPRMEVSHHYTYNGNTWKGVG